MKKQNETFHYLNFRTHCHATEDLVKVKKAFAFIVGSMRIELTKARGYHGNPIAVLRAKVKKRKNIIGFWERVSDSLPKLEEILKRVRGCALYLRFDKESALEEKPKLVSHGNVILVRGKIKAYPATQEKAVAKLKEFFSQHLPTIANKL